jgi:hypothetical protein
LETSGANVLFLAPWHAILKALARDNEFPLLGEVIGKEPTGRKKQGGTPKTRRVAGVARPEALRPGGRAQLE